jgi:hypothetical protein
LKLVSQISTPKVHQNQNGGTEMTHHKQNTAIGQMLEAIIENGLEGLAAAVSTLLNEAMKVERSRALGAEPWQRSQGRLGYPNYCETPLPTSPKYTYAPRWPKTSAAS